MSTHSLSAQFILELARMYVVYSNADLTTAVPWPSARAGVDVITDLPAIVSTATVSLAHKGLRQL